MSQKFYGALFGKIEFLIFDFEGPSINYDTILIILELSMQQNLNNDISPRMRGGFGA